uniref:Uncharacterized protein n=1 Tax=Nelumbo nucifera TaxID=4432 RepID=A0A822XUR5_NELNU|nr:TPA_asm: hypothetical protein HUJ06_025573 [Nelumbo nucifera]
MDSLLLLVKSLIAGLLVLSFFLYSCLRWARTHKSTTDGKIKTAAPNLVYLVATQQPSCHEKGPRGAGHPSWKRKNCGRNQILRT